MKEEGDDLYSFHFTRNHQTNNMLELHMWYKLPLMKDFKEYLAKHG